MVNFLISCTIFAVIFLTPLLISLCVTNNYNGVVDRYTDSSTIIRMELGAVTSVTVPGHIGKKGDIVRVNIKEHRIVSESH